MADAPSRVDPQAEAALRALAEAAARDAEAAEDPAARAAGWAAPAGFDPLDPSAPAGFDRAGINAAYAAALSGADRSAGCGVAASLTLQADLLAALERARRLRHASPVRCAAHASARRAGHGHPAGPLTGLALGYLGDLAGAGRAGGGGG